MKKLSISEDEIVGKNYADGTNYIRRGCDHRNHHIIGIEFYLQAANCEIIGEHEKNEERQDNGEPYHKNGFYIPCNDQDKYGDKRIHNCTECSYR